MLSIGVWAWEGAIRGSALYTQNRHVLENENKKQKIKHRNLKTIMKNEKWETNIKNQKVKVEN